MVDGGTSDTPPNLGARLTGSAARRLMVFALVVLVLDQVSKQYMLDWIFATPQVYPVLPFVNLVPVWNPGISFGMLADGGLVARIGLTCLAFAVAGWFFWNSHSFDKWQNIAAGLITGGAIGNAIDRLRFGKVVDFIDVYVQTWHWPAFNVADAAISVGAMFWIYSILFGQERDNT